jgi:hypothetical protein
MPRAHPQFGQALGRREISRRDVLNGLLLAAGGSTVCESIPFRALAAGGAGGRCDGPIDRNARALRGGNLPSSIRIGHWLRDRRLSFGRSGLSLAPGCDNLQGTFPVLEQPGYDVIVVGAGLAGLSATFHILRAHPKARMLLLEANPSAGGNAGRDVGPPLSIAATTGGAYCCTPSTRLFRELFRELKIEWENQVIAEPGDCYFFDAYAPGIRSGYRGWNIDTLHGGMEDIPYESNVVRDLLRSKSAFVALTNRKNGPDDPPDHSSGDFDDLSQISLDHYLTQVLHCDPIVSDFYTLYTIDALGGTARDVNAHSAISFLGSEFGDDDITFVGGMSELAARFVHWLTEAEGRLHHPPQIEFSAVALRVDASDLPSHPGASVTFVKDGAFYRATANAVIMAAQSQITRHLIEHLLDGDRRSAWDQFNTVPVVTANVALTTAAPLLELGLGYSQAWWGSRHWANFSVADWITDQREDPDRPTVLTFYGGNSVPPGELAGERVKLLQTPFSDYEKSLKEDLSRILAGSTFDFDQHVSAIFVYRWGHSMIMPTPNWLFGTTRKPSGLLDRNRAPRRIACRPIGPIFFAGQHTEGTPSVESAIVSGYRAAHQALDRL